MCNRNIKIWRSFIPIDINNEKLTKEDLIFLHLLDCIHYHEDYIVPELITQKGIQNIVHCDRSVISRILKKNEMNGYIYRKLMKIEKLKRKQHAFYLTGEGLARAEELRKKISDWD